MFHSFAYSLCLVQQFVYQVSQWTWVTVRIIPSSSPWFTQIPPQPLAAFQDESLKGVSLQMAGAFETAQLLSSLLDLLELLLELFDQFTVSSHFEELPRFFLHQ
jgi:hypothetical protein